MKKSKRFFAMLMVLLTLAALFPTTLTSAAEILNFPLRTNIGDVLVADSNTLVTVVAVQNPTTKMITATFQVQQGLDPVVANREKVTITGISAVMFYNGKIAPYDPATGTMFSEPTINTQIPEFKRYAKSLITDFDVFGTSMTQRDMSTGTGGFLGSMLSYAGSHRLEIEPGAAPVSIMEFYFMPVGAEQDLTLDMLSFGYYYHNISMSRVTNRIGNGTTFLEGERRHVTSSNKYIINPNSFKLHIQRAKPNINADNFYTVYDPANMEWSTSANGTYSSTVPTLSAQETIYVRAKGTDYSGSDESYVNYKKYIPSEPVAVVLGPVVSDYTVTYKANGGTGADVVVPVTQNQQYTIATNPFTAPAGQYFNGWNTLAGGTGTSRAPGSMITITGDVVLHAQWSANSYNVTYKANGGTGADKIVPVTYNQQYQVEANTFGAPAGQSFTGWNTVAGGTGTPYAVGNTINITGDVTLHAQWGTTNYSVTYKANGGTGADVVVPVVSNQQYIIVANTFGAPAGQVFAGWNTAAGGTGTSHAVNSSVTITGDLVLHAQWSTTPPQKVTYRANGGTGADVVVDAPYNQVYTIAANTFTPPTGQSFNGWNTMANGNGTSYQPGGSVTITADLVLFAQWTPASYKITYKANGGVGADKEVNVKYGDVYTVEGNTFTAPANNIFNGWNTVAGGTGTPYAAGATINITGDVTLFAQWQYVQPNAITVNFNPNGGTLTGPTSKEVFTGSPYGTLPGESGAWRVTAPPGSTFLTYEFAGWFTTPLAGNTKIEEDTIVTLTTTHTLYARWYTKGIDTYTITFDGNNGVPETQMRTVVQGETLGNDMPDEPTRVNYDFVEWNTAIDGTGTKFDGTTPITRNLRVFAKWDPRPTFFTVTFHGNGGLPTSQTVSVEQGTALEANMPDWPTRTGHLFAGWNTRQDGSGDDFTDKTIVNGSMAVYAKWTPEPLTVTYNANGGTGVEVVANTVYGATYTIAGNTYTAPAGHDFSGWNEEADGSGKAYTVGEQVPISESLMLYAKWTSNTYTVTFNGNGGPATVTVDVPRNTALGAKMPADPKRSGYTFNGWNTMQNGSGTAFTGSVVVTANIEVFAQWKENAPPPPGGGGTTTTNYTVTFNGNGGTPATQTRTVAANAAVGTANMPHNPALSEHIFKGWNTKEDGSGTAFTAATTVTANITVYAQWEKDIDDTGVPKGFIDEHIPYIQGYPDNTVKPDNNITRAEVAMIFFRLLVDEGKNASRQSVFSDVANGVWYAQAVNYLASIEILMGYPDGTFRPNQPITRAEFAAVASRFDELEPLDSNAFPDIAGHWAIDYINSAAAKGWVNGYTDGTFDPQRKITRAETVKIVNTMLNRKILLEDIPAGIRQFTDFEGHWAYTHLVEASNEHDFERKSDGYEIWTLK